MVNRVGDFGFALGIFGVYVLFGSIDFDVIFANALSYAEEGNRAMMEFAGYQVDALTVICLLLFMGAMGTAFACDQWQLFRMNGCLLR